MCVRTLTSNDENESESTIEQEQIEIPQIKSKFSKAKEKYMKIYEETVNRDSAKDEKIHEKKEEDATTVTDVLGKSTMHYRTLMNITLEYYEAWQNSKLYKILFTTTQPAHIIMIIAILCILSSVFPTSDVKAHKNTGQSNSKLLSFIYLSSFALHFGSQMWMTFVSGLSLYFALPRYAFGQVQRVLFPRYFTINACLSLITLLIFLKHHPFGSWDTEITVQISAMFIAFFIELLIRLYLTPPLLQLMKIKCEIERSSNVGQEIGHYNLGPLKHCPHYMKIHYAFRKAHSGVAMGNIITMACTILHLYFVSSRICIA